MTKKQKIEEIVKLASGSTPMLLQSHCDLLERWTGRKLQPGPIGQHNGVMSIYLDSDELERFEAELNALPPLPESFLLFKFIHEIITGYENR